MACLSSCSSVSPPCLRHSTILCAAAPPPFSSFASRSVDPSSPVLSPAVLLSVSEAARLGLSMTTTRELPGTVAGSSEMTRELGDQGA